MTKSSKEPLSLLYLQKKLKEVQEDADEIFYSKEVANDKTANSKSNQRGSRY